MMYDNRYQRRQMRRTNRRYYRNSMGGLATGFFFIGLALAFALSSAIGGNWFLPVFFAGLAFCALIGSASSMNPRGLYGGIQGFAWLMGLAFCFLFGFWPWILVVIGISSILGALYVPLVTSVLGAGIFASMQPQQPGSYDEGGQQYPYPPSRQQAPQPKQEYDQPQTQYPPQELPPQQ